MSEVDQNLSVNNESSTEQFLRVKSPKVIVADDESPIRTLLKMILTSAKYELVGEAADGEEALRLVKEKKPDILLLDIEMPLKKGSEVLVEVLKVFPEVCVIMVTSFCEALNVKNCLLLGASGYIRKDIPVHRIKKTIENSWEEFSRRKGWG